MKKGFLKKLAIIFSASIGILTLASCQTIEKNAYIAKEGFSCEIFSDTSGKRTAVVTMPFVNPSIYDVLEFKLTYNVYVDNPLDPTDEKGVLKGEQTDLLPVRLAHGTAVAVRFSIPCEDNTTKRIEAVNFEATKYDSIWGTYLAWWIIIISIVAIGLIVYTASICTKGLTLTEIKEMQREHLASSLSVALLILIICLFPLLFSSWVSTLIMVGGYLTFIILSALITLIRSAVVSKQ